MMIQRAVLAMITMMTVELACAQSPFWSRDKRDSDDWRDHRYRDPVDRRLDEISELYRDRKFRDASVKLRQLAAELDRQEAARKGPVFPRNVAGWTIKDTKRKSVKPDGFAITYHYRLGKKGIYSSLHKGSDETIQYIRMITHSGWLRRSGARTFNIQGYQAVVTAERRLHIAIDRETLLEVRGDSDRDTTERDLVRFTSALDLCRLRWVK